MDSNLPPMLHHKPYESILDPPDRRRKRPTVSPIKRSKRPLLDSSLGSFNSFKPIRSAEIEIAEMNRTLRSSSEPTAEVWIRTQLEQSNDSLLFILPKNIDQNQQDYYDPHDPRPKSDALEKLGLDRVSLHHAGISVALVERLYRALYVYTSGLHSLMREIGQKDSHLMINIWALFVFLLEKCDQESYQMTISQLTKETTEWKQRVSTDRAIEQSNLEKIKKQNQKLESKTRSIVAEKDNQIDSLKRDMIIRTSELDEAKTKIAQLSQTISNRDSAVAAAEKRSSQAFESLEDREKALKEMMWEKTALNKKLMGYESQLADQMNRIESQEQDMNRLLKREDENLLKLKDFEQHKINNDRTITNLSLLKQQANEQLMDLRQKLDFERMNVAQSRKKERHLNAILHHKNAEILGIEEKMKVIQDHLVEEQERRAVTHTELTESKEICKNLEAQVEILKDTISLADAKYQDKVQEHLSDQEVAQELRVRAFELESDLKAANDFAADFRVQLAASQAEALNSETKLNESMSKVTKLTHLAGDLKCQLQETKIENHTLLEKLTTCQHALSEREQVLNGEIQQLDAELETMTLELDEVSRENTLTGQRLSMADAAIGKMVEKNRNDKLRISFLENQVQIFQSDDIIPEPIIFEQFIDQVEEPEIDITSNVAQEMAQELNQNLVQNLAQRMYLQRMKQEQRHRQRIQERLNMVQEELLTIKALYYKSSMDVGTDVMSDVSSELDYETDEDPRDLDVATTQEPEETRKQSVLVLFEPQNSLDDVFVRCNDQLGMVSEDLSIRIDQVKDLRQKLDLTELDKSKLQFEVIKLKDEAMVARERLNMTTEEGNRTQQVLIQTTQEVEDQMEVVKCIKKNNVRLIHTSKILNAKNEKYQHLLARMQMKTEDYASTLLQWARRDIVIRKPTSTIGSQSQVLTMNRSTQTAAETRRSSRKERRTSLLPQTGLSLQSFKTESTSTRRQSARQRRASLKPAVISSALRRDSAVEASPLSIHRPSLELSSEAVIPDQELKPTTETLVLPPVEVDFYHESLRNRGKVRNARRRIQTTIEKKHDEDLQERVAILTMTADDDKLIKDEEPKKVVIKRRNRRSSMVLIKKTKEPTETRRLSIQQEQKKEEGIDLTNVATSMHAELLALKSSMNLTTQVVEHVEREIDAIPEATAAAVSVPKRRQTLRIQMPCRKKSENEIDQRIQRVENMFSRLSVLKTETMSSEEIMTEIVQTQEEEEEESESESESDSFSEEEDEFLQDLPVIEDDTAIPIIQEPIIDTIQEPIIDTIQEPREAEKISDTSPTWQAMAEMEEKIVAPRKQSNLEAIVRQAHETGHVYYEKKSQGWQLQDEVQVPAILYPLASSPDQRNQPELTSSNAKDHQ